MSAVAKFGPLAQVPTTVVRDLFIALHRLRDKRLGTLSLWDPTYKCACALGVLAVHVKRPPGSSVEPREFAKLAESAYALFENDKWKSIIYSANDGASINDEATRWKYMADLTAKELTARGISLPKRGDR